MLEVVAASDIVRSSLLTLWTAVAGFLPQLIAAVVVFLVGWLIAVLLGKVAYHIVKILQVDRALDSVGFKDVWERSSFKLNTPYLFYELVKWFFIVVFLMSATNILGLTQVTDFLREVVKYIPKVIVAVIILLIGILVAKFFEGIVRASVKSAQLSSANFLGTVARWFIIIFALLAALFQLNVADKIIVTLIQGVIGAAALAVGLAFGLGGQGHADDAIRNMRKKIQD